MKHPSEEIVYVENISSEPASWNADGVLYTIPPGGTLPVARGTYYLGTRNLTAPGSSCPLKLVDEDEGTLAYAELQSTQAEDELKAAEEFLSAKRKEAAQKKKLLEVQKRADKSNRSKAGA